VANGAVQAVRSVVKPDKPLPSRHRGRAGKLLSAQGDVFLAALQLPDSARERVAVALDMIAALVRQLAPLEQQLRRLARR
jgi:hypothetical protein